LSRPSGSSEYQHCDDRPVLVSTVAIRKNRKVTNLENMTHAADKSSLTDNSLCGLKFSCQRNHFPVLHNSGRRRQMLPRKRCSTPSANIVVYSWKQNWQDIPGLAATYSVSEISGHTFCI
jgi:hypothetical protein